MSRYEVTIGWSLHGGIYVKEIDRSCLWKCIPPLILIIVLIHFLQVMDSCVVKTVNNI